MPDYLQDLIDRSQAYQDPATYPIDTNVPAPWEDQTPKKKRGQQQASVFPGGVGSGDDTPAPDQGPPMVFIPGRGYVPRTPPPPLPALTQQAGLLPGGGLPSATPVFPSGVPTPQARPPEAPSREVDGQPPAGSPANIKSAAQQASETTDKLGPARGSYLSDPSAAQQAGQQAGMLGPLGNIGNWLGQHSNALLAMGAGLMGAPNVWQGLGRGFAFAGPAAQQDIKMQTLLSQQGAAYNALKTAGVPDDLARLGATDKDVMKQLMDQYIVGQKYELKSIDRTDSWGQ